MLLGYYIINDQCLVHEYVVWLLISSIRIAEFNSL